MRQRSYTLYEHINTNRAVTIELSNITLFQLPNGRIPHLSVYCSTWSRRTIPYGSKYSWYGTVIQYGPSRPATASLILFPPSVLSKLLPTGTVFPSRVASEGSISLPKDAAHQH
ncbi:hypothetical protein Vretifemale_630, partial [Volvox reticuliferus]